MMTRKLTKYYVESGPHFQFVTLAETPLQAIVKALELIRHDEPLRLADLMIVNQRGFAWNRPGQTLYGDETIAPTRLLLGEPERSVAPSE